MYYENSLSYFCPKKCLFLPISIKVCPKRLPFPSFQGNFTTLLLLKFLLFKQEVPVRSSPLSLISGFFNEKK